MSQQSAQINEPIEVLVIFTQKGPEIRAFKWQGRKIEVEKINLVYNAKVGGEAVTRFSVSSKTGNTYQLALNRATLEWTVKGWE